MEIYIDGYSISDIRRIVQVGKSRIRHIRLANIRPDELEIRWMGIGALWITLYGSTSHDTRVGISRVSVGSVAAMTF